MNAIFIITCLISSAIITITQPDKLIATMQNGAIEALKLSSTLLAIYALWFGIFKIMEQTGIVKKISKILKKPLRFIFGDMGEAETATALNVSANLLGLGGIATPMGINAAELYDKQNNLYAKTMLFVLAATSLQLLPLSIISLRVQCGSQMPSDIVLPSILSTLISTFCGVLLVKIFVKK